MKIVMQHGHVVKRQDIEGFIEQAPNSWCKAFESIIIYTEINKPIRITFHPKEKVLGVHVSRKYDGTAIEVVEEVAVAAQAIEELGHLPNKLAKSKDLQFRQQWAQMRKQ
jgi:hypothetical protein